MRPAEWRIEAVLKGLLPALTAVFCVFLGALPYGIPYLAVVMPWLGLMPIYYWSIHAPHYLPLWAAFLVGLWQDALTGGPLGLFALIFLLVRYFVGRQRHIFYKKAFLVGWWGFALVTAMAGLTGWGIASLYYGTALSATPFVVQSLLTIMVYPVIAWLLGGLWMVVSE